MTRPHYETETSDFNRFPPMPANEAEIYYRP
jgi:hypothetical protein